MGIDLNLLFIVVMALSQYTLSTTIRKVSFIHFILLFKELIEPVSRPRRCAMVEELLQYRSWVKLLLFGEFGGAVSTVGLIVFSLSRPNFFYRDLGFQVKAILRRPATQSSI